MLPALILVPTAHEAQLLGAMTAPVEVCGFGLATAGAGAAYAIALHRPQRVVLAGVSGSYDLARAPLGWAMSASAVRCAGIGAGEQSAADLGWADSDQIELRGGDGLVLSVASASGDAVQAAQRHQQHPGAVVEEMEGYAVAVAATLNEVPLIVVRGVSNAAGDRDHSGWQMQPAMNAVRALVASMLG